MTLARKALVRPDESLSQEMTDFGSCTPSSATPPTRLRQRNCGRSSMSVSPNGSKSVPQRLAEVEEIVGYHLEESVRYRRALGEPRSSSPCARPRALLRPGNVARRGDYTAASNLLSRAHNSFLARTVADSILHCRSVRRRPKPEASMPPSAYSGSQLRRHTKAGTRHLPSCSRWSCCAYATRRIPPGRPTRLGDSLNGLFPSSRPPAMTRGLRELGVSRRVPTGCKASSVLPRRLRNGR